MSADDPHWLSIARELRAMAQTGLTFTADRFDRQRYERIRELAATMLAQGSGGDYGTILGILREDKGYATPKVDVRGAAFVEGRVLLVREISDGKWTLPGGWADVNQPAAECVVREIAEESGFAAKALKLARPSTITREAIGRPATSTRSIKSSLSAKSRAARPAPAMKRATWRSSRAMPCRRCRWGGDHPGADRQDVSACRASGTCGGLRMIAAEFSVGISRYVRDRLAIIVHQP